jgi:hypothetical protein
LGLEIFREAEQRFLLLFLEKEEYHSRIRWVAPGSPCCGLGLEVFREAEQRFLLLFLEKEGYHYRLR